MITCVVCQRTTERNYASWHCFEVCITQVVCLTFHRHRGWMQLSAVTSSQIETFRTSGRHLYYIVQFVLFIYEQNNIQFIVSNSHMIPPIFLQYAQNTCIKIHWLHLSKLAAVSSQQWEQWLYTGLMGNAKVEYHLRIQCYCLQWLNVTHMDENSF